MNDLSCMSSLAALLGSAAWPIQLLLDPPAKVLMPASK